ncbi:MAG: hypothetical protein Kow0047_13490 [Anaerolineae bacterium]
MRLWQRYVTPTELSDVLRLLADCGPEARIIAGGTDLIIELERRIREASVLIDVSRLPGLGTISSTPDVVEIGAAVTHHQAVASDLVVRHLAPLAEACWQVGAPQIRNRGTIAGNLVTASPANDTITPLWAMGALVELASARGRRTLSFPEFFLGVRRTAMEPDEMVTSIRVPILGPQWRGAFLKLGLRRAQAISVVNAAVLVRLGDAVVDGAPRVAEARIALGAVAPTIIRSPQAEAVLANAPLSDDVIEEAAQAAAADARPIDDIRGSAAYRREMVRVLVRRALRRIRSGAPAAALPDRPVFLGGDRPNRPWRGPALTHESDREDVIEARVNGEEVRIRGASGKTLLQMLREDLGLIGVKEGCAEGECGACTVIMDGMAVMACLVPAPRAHGAEIFTVEGLPGFDGQWGDLHPVQRGFIEAGAVQCGYCTPGLVVSAAELLAERPQPTLDEIQQALTGNLCRCTGYYSIVQAVERAARLKAGTDEGRMP